MEDRTREYLRGRFGDHYRRVARSEGITAPPAANEREWGYIPFSPGGTTMVRHESLLDLTGGADLGAFLARERPRHAYFSAGRYDHPGEDSMGGKGWRGSDLIFDIDADHLPGIDLETDGYGEMLEAGKAALLDLLDFVESDFGFEECVVVFSGGRGYHVHVRDTGVQALGREERREVVDYVRGLGVTFDGLVRREQVEGFGRKTPADKRTLPTEGGWAGRIHRHLLELVDELLDAPEEEALSRLREFDGIGEGKARAALRAARENREAVASGNVDVHPAFYGVAEQLFEGVREADGAPIDEPVTTDINRLIRLPGSLHGGTGLRVCRIDRDDLEGFDPLVDAVADTFRGNRIMVDLAEPLSVTLGGEKFNLHAGVQSVPEHLGVFAMARGSAEKARE
ncbi:MAG: DNA primase small subunit PriS [Haloarculaceae archaeon]